MKYFYYFSISIIFFFGCKTSEKAGEKVSEEDILATWVGTIDCEECSGIDYELTLLDNNKFYELIVHQDKAGNELIKKGNWSLKDNILNLYTADDQKEYKKLKVVNGKLLLTDNNSKIGSLEKSSKPRTSSYYINKAIKGIDFTGSGHHPKWEIDIDFDGNIHIRYPDKKIDYTTPVPKNVADNSGNTLIYVIESEKSNLTLTLNKQECFDDQLKETFDYSVTATLKLISMDEPVTLEGCGRFLGDYRLHDIWVLAAINDKPLDPGIVFKQSPFLELNLTQRHLTGFTGCNRVKGKLSFNQSSLIVTDISGTKMKCQAESLESQFLEILTFGVLDYTFEKRKMTLQNKRGKLSFKKVD
ncbi:META domain-containing protein [Mangrovivirga sp. M17]|uniref:META domain-containing protein n=1 Tax=Mangrovivirga halotolerans TaxID=2993936 RepID=A0ABT3RM31_9BACT|nr:META domain-containing protein [Mangrovivirga halotolerans]MCX2742342.1 META domain-containing protein [Mangrovivirga halotolerans]